MLYVCIRDLIDVIVYGHEDVCLWLVRILWQFSILRSAGLTVC